MTRKEKLLKKARNSPNSLRFEELCFLAELYGYVFDRRVGSHRIYKHYKRPGLMNFQSDDGKAKEYQVKQLLNAIIDIIALEETEGN